MEWRFVSVVGFLPDVESPEEYDEIVGYRKRRKRTAERAAGIHRKVDSDAGT